MGRYSVWCEGLGQERRDGKTFAEAGALEAAQAWASWNDQHGAERGIVGGREMDVIVEDLDKGDRSRWRVTGGYVPEYRAQPVPAPVAATTVPEAGPLAVIVRRYTADRDHLRKTADAVDAVLQDVRPGDRWVDAHDANLVVGNVYVVRRRFKTGVGNPGLSRWTRNGWRDEYGAPLSALGIGVHVLVPSNE